MRELCVHFPGREGGKGGGKEEGRLLSASLLACAKEDSAL